MIFICYSLQLVLLLVAVAALPLITEGKKDRNDLLCTICLDIVEDIDSWLTSDTTEEQIVDWIDNICQVNPE